MTAAKRPRKPYLIRAMHEWMIDNGQTPHLVVDAAVPGVNVPRRYVEDGKIILNVGAHATQGLSLGNEFVEFEARFDGAPCQVRVPVPAVLGIYARETGQGMLFTEPDPGVPGGESPPDDATKSRPPHLKIIK
ncbi:MAG TPA: ClpXP protease specificity-enhancing factor [Gammaproteobacteria bacterium]|nr:ClpXP protease specificity-enhancing factor [Gammaproteobacteria bacterium]